MPDETLAQPMTQGSARWTTRTRFALASLALASFSLVFAEFLPAGLLTPMADGLAISHGMAGQTVTATAISGMLTALLVGFVIGRLDRKTVMIALCILGIASNAMSALAPSFAVVLVARVLLGIALGGFWSLASALIVRLVSLDGIGKGMSVIMVGVSLSSITAPSLGTLIADAVGWRMAFAAGTAAAVIALIATIVALPRLPATDALRLGTLTTIIRRRMVVVTLLGVVSIASAHFAALTYVRPFLETVTHLSPTVVAEVLFAFGVANFLGNLFTGAFVDRRLRTMLANNSLLIAISTIGLAAFGADLVPAAIGVVVWGFAFGGTPTVLQTYGARAASDHLEAVGGLFVATFQISIGMGAAVGGVIVDHSSTVYVMLFSGVMACGAAALSLVRPKS